MNVIGLDLSLTATGIAYADGTTTTVKARQAEGDRRLLTIVTAVDAAITSDTTLAVIEDLPTHAHSAGITGMVHGAVRALLMTTGVPYAVVPPATLKAFATGSGAADKTSMALGAYKRAGLEFADDNACDAWWLRIAGLTHLGQAPLPLPAAQLARLDKVTWPELGAVAA